MHMHTHIWVCIIVYIKDNIQWLGEFFFRQFMRSGLIVEKSINSIKLKLEFRH